MALGLERPKTKTEFQKLGCFEWFLNSVDIYGYKIEFQINHYFNFSSESTFWPGPAKAHVRSNVGGAPGSRNVRFHVVCKMVEQLES